MRTFTLTLIACSTVLVGCNAEMATEMERDVFNASVIGATGYREFVPTHPIESPLLTFYDDSGAEVTKAWSQLNNDEVRDKLTIIRSEISVAKRSDSGELTYLVAKGTLDRGEYRVVMDYSKYRAEAVTEPVSGRHIGDARVGVGLRVEADVRTLKSGINLGSLFALGVAAATDQLVGNLSVHIIGISGTDIDGLTVLNAAIDQTSIEKTLQSLAVIKSKLSDDATRFTPHVLWVKPLEREIAPETINAEVATRRADGQA